MIGGTAQGEDNRFDDEFFNDGGDFDGSEFKPEPAPPNEDEKKRLQRLERNREIARKCRKRKRERASALSDEVTRLRETNRELERQLQISQSKLGQATSGRGNRGKDEESRRLDEVKRMGEMLKQRASEEEIKDRMKAYTEMYADYGKERMNVIKILFSQLEQTLMPTQISKMLLWLLSHEDTFYNDSNDIWRTLLKDLKLDDRQVKEFLSHRQKLGTQSSGMKKVLKSLKLLAEEIEQNMNRRRQQMEHITNLITPAQQAKFLLWIEENQACIHLLNNLWKPSQKVDPEEVKSKSLLK